VDTAFESQAVQRGRNCNSNPLSCPKDGIDDKIINIIIIIIVITLLFQSVRVTIIVKSESKKPQSKRKMI
jgi:hypothetical protein